MDENQAPPMGYQTLGKDPIKDINTLFAQKEQELKQVSIQRQLHTEKILKDCQSQLMDRNRKLGFLEREYLLLKTENGDQKAILLQYEERFSEVKKHIESLNMEKQQQFQQMTEMNEILQDRVQKLQNENDEFRNLKQSLYQKQRDVEWNKDQEIKTLNKQIQKLKDESDSIKVSSIQDIERLREEKADRYKVQMKAKNGEITRLESMYTERIQNLQKEVNKLHVQLDQQMQIEADVREKAEKNRQKADDLQLMVHKGQENERKELIEMQIKLSQITQEKTIKDEYHNKQVLELKQNLQSEILEKERLQVELKSSNERHSHELQLQKERYDLDKERNQSQFDRQFQISSDKVKEAEQNAQYLQQKIEKLESQMQESGFQHKKDLDDLQEKSQDMQSKFEKQIRELRTQINMKSKDLQNQREESSDLESRLTQKIAELKSCRSQLQVVQSRYEEAMSELDQSQTGHIKQMSRQNRDALDEMARQVEDLRNENLDLKETIREMKRERLVMTNGQQQMFQQEQFYNDDVDPLINHFNEYNEQTSNMKRSLSEQELSKMGPDDKDQQIHQLQQQNQELGQIIEQMTQDMQVVRQQAIQKSHSQDQPLDTSNHKQALFDLRRDHYVVQTEKRRLELENQILKAAADGGEQRLRERAHFEDQIKELQNIILDSKDRQMKKDIEISQLQSKVYAQENQIENLKRERDRLLEVSKNLKISLNKMEKQQVMDSVKFEHGGLGATLGNKTAFKAQISSITKSSEEIIPQKMTSQENQMEQLYDEVNQMKKLMAQLKKGNAIGEIFEKEQLEKGQRLQDLKNQRQMLDVSDYKGTIQKSIDDIQKLRTSVQQSPMRDESVLLDLDKKEKQLSKMLMSGMENFQPNLNMFGSNVFSSIQTDLLNIKESYDQVNLHTIESKKQQDEKLYTMGRSTNEMSLHQSSENLTINIERQDAKPVSPLKKLINQNQQQSRSRQNLERLKNDYNSAILDEMFP